jgi:hypothetical protein
MSHIKALTDSKKICDTTGDCNEYRSQLNQMDRDIDSYVATANQEAITWGVLVGLVGLVILLTPFVEPLRRFQRFLLPKLAIAAPVLIGVAVGGAIGFAITFSACFKQECSPVEGTAIFTLPAVSLILSIPLARRIARKRAGMAERLRNSKPTGWIIAGTLVILLAAYAAAANIKENASYLESQKKYIRSVER